jgi:leader peptidase (prepilin peptidase) / N-methyltransferase
MLPLDATGWMIVLVWVFLGGSVGSFMNVVVYRLPLGLSLIWPPSHCPRCKNPIPWFDNVPVFGWIMLRGKCRHCRLPIAIRYPLVEAIAAAMFGLTAFAGCLSHGPILFYVGNIYYLFLLGTLLCAGLIELDGNRPPWKLYVPALLVGAVLPWFWPMDWPLAAWPGLPDWVSVPVNVLAGISVGVVLGGAARWMPRLRKPNGLALGLPCVGLILGWQAAGVLAIATMAVDAVFWRASPALSRLRPPPSLVLWFLGLLWILIWSSLALLS